MSDIGITVRQDAYVRHLNRKTRIGGAVQSCLLAPAVLSGEVSVVMPKSISVLVVVPKLVVVALPKSYSTMLMPMCGCPSGCSASR